MTRDQYEKAAIEGQDGIFNRRKFIQVGARSSLLAATSALVGGCSVDKTSEESTISAEDNGGMSVIDYGLSFISGKARGNRVRFWVSHAHASLTSAHVSTRITTSVLLVRVSARLPSRTFSWRTTTIFLPSSGRKMASSSVARLILTRLTASGKQRPTCGKDRTINCISRYRSSFFRLVQIFTKQPPKLFHSSLRQKLAIRTPDCGLSLNTPSKR